MKLQMENDIDDDRFAGEFQGWMQLNNDEEDTEHHGNNNKGRQRSGITDLTNESREGGTSSRALTALEEQLVVTELFMDSF